jgi:hypothetical protein
MIRNCIFYRILLVTAVGVIVEYRPANRPGARKMMDRMECSLTSRRPLSPDGLTDRMTDGGGAEEVRYE